MLTYVNILLHIVSSFLQYAILVFLVTHENNDTSIFVIYPKLCTAIIHVVYRIYVLARIIICSRKNIK